MPLKFPHRIQSFYQSLKGTHLAYHSPFISRILSSSLNFIEFGSGNNFSTRPSRNLPESGISDRDERESSSSKTLIEDEEELSNWVSGFRTRSSSSHDRLTSDDDDSGAVVNRSWGRNQDRREIRSQVNSFRGRESRFNGHASSRGKKEPSFSSGFRKERTREDYKGLGKKQDNFEDESSDEDVKSLVMGGLGCLLSEDDEEEDEDYEFLKRKAAFAFGFHKEMNAENVKTSDSIYLRQDSISIHCLLNR